MKYSLFQCIKHLQFYIDLLKIIHVLKRFSQYAIPAMHVHDEIYLHERKYFNLKSFLRIVWMSNLDFLRPIMVHFTAVHIILYPTENCSLAIAGYFVMYFSLIESVVSEKCIECNFDCWKFYYVRLFLFFSVVLPSYDISYRQSWDPQWTV